METIGAYERFPFIPKYDVLEEIGHGGMAVVYRAHDKRLARDVAIKLIHPHLRDSPEVARRFVAEAKIVARLRHPNIVEVFDVSPEDATDRYLVVEYVRGVTLRKLLQESGSMPPEVAGALGVEILNALAHAHAEGVIHRDIKPENVMVEARGDTSPSSDRGRSERRIVRPSGATRTVVKLTDFGIAKLLDAQGVTSTGEVLGSPAHMAPEQIEGVHVDARADIFALGVLLYECMVGHLPFVGTNPAQVLRRVLEGEYAPAEVERPTVGKRWSHILDRALAHNVADRFTDAHAMRDAIIEELRRLHVAEPMVEFDVWRSDAKGYAERHAREMIAALCTEAGAARKSGDAVAAAADYNRALAYAPADAGLLRVVAGINRAESQKRSIRRWLRIAAITFAIAGLFVAIRPLFKRFLSKANEPRTISIPVVSPPTVDPQALRVHVDPPVDLPVARAIEKPIAPIAPEKPLRDAHGTARRAPTPASSSESLGRAAAHAKPDLLTVRHITLANVRPPFGVTVMIDQEAARGVTSGDVLTVDGRPHTLTFSCVHDACEVTRRPLLAGDANESLAISMAIRPALLVIEGHSGMTYQVTEEPTLAVHPGIPVRIPMRGSKYSVHVVELPSNRTLGVTLTAGQEKRVSFAEESR